MPWLRKSVTAAVAKVQCLGTGGGAEVARACRAGAIGALRVFSTRTVDTASW